MRSTVILAIALICLMFLAGCASPSGPSTGSYTSAGRAPAASQQTVALALQIKRCDKPRYTLALDYASWDDSDYPVPPENAVYQLIQQELMSTNCFTFDSDARYRLVSNIDLSGGNTYLDDPVVGSAAKIGALLTLGASLAPAVSAETRTATVTFTVTDTARGNVHLNIPPIVETANSSFKPEIDKQIVNAALTKAINQMVSAFQSQS